MELAHLQVACDLMRSNDGREPEEVLAPELPEPVTFEPNKAYLRELLDTQIDLTTLGTGYVQDAHERFEKMQDAIMGGGQPPSETVMDMHQEKFGRDYRLSTEGEHPVESLRQAEARS
jgi:hypothetical protein